jgi:site-specific recombinase XerC
MSITYKQHMLEVNKLRAGLKELAGHIEALQTKIYRNVHIKHLQVPDNIPDD